MHKEKIKLEKSGRSEVMGHVLAPFLLGLIFFACAGRFDLYRSWIWMGATTLYYLGGLWVLIRANPQLLNARGNWKGKKDAMAWDRPVLMVFAGIGVYGHVVLMALDVGRFGWSQLNPWFILPGLMLYTGGFNLVYWSMAVNKHFETTVRIQHDRDHKVVTWGPYQIVRHPGYLGLILSNYASAMILGSLYGILTATATLAILAYRTWREDLTLQKELEGYLEYTSTTRFRLLPFIW
jgi:protein-S-isoprenylcysteine O-methyltransferase Ste14